MSERLKELKWIAGQTKVADTSVDGPDHPVISSWYQTLFFVAGRVQPGSRSYEAAQRILDVIERNGPPEEINMNDVERVFHATGGTFERIVIK